MPQFIFTLLALVVFFGVLVAERYPIFSHGVSWQTTVDQHHDTFSVRSGVSQNGDLLIVEILDLPHVSHRIQVPNHERNLRAFIAASRSGVPLVYVEQAKPNKFFALQGAFIVSPETVAFAWVGTTTLSFFGTSPEGIFMHFVVDVHEVSMTKEIVTTLPEFVPTRTLIDTSI